MAPDWRNLALATPVRGTLSESWRGAIAITIAAGALRLLVAGTTPLFPDETYYWEWSRRLAAGYYDHPPLIAWAIRGGTALFGNTPLGVRAGPVLLGVVGALLLGMTARRLGGDRAGWWLAAAFAATPLASGLVLATPDAPLLAAAALVLYAVVRALQAPARSRDTLRWWCVAGVALGLAVASKYTAVLLALGIAGGLLVAMRDRLATPWPYVATGIALAVFSPVVLWNATNEWISFAFQLRHGLGAVGGSALDRELELVGGQLALLSPILAALCAIAVGRHVRRRTDPVPTVLAVAALVVFAFFMYSATKRRVEANWPALAWLPALALGVVRVDDDRWRRWLGRGVVLAAALSVIVYVNAFVPLLPVPARRDPAARAHGWRDLSAAVGEVYTPRLSRSSSRTWVAGNRYQEASMLAFLLPGHPETFALNIGSRANHYALWPTFTQRASPNDALILVVDELAETHPAVVALTPHFGRVSRGEMVTLARDGDPVKYLRIWMLEGWRGSWPR